MYKTLFLQMVQLQLKRNLQMIQLQLKRNSLISHWRPSVFIPETVRGRRKQLRVTQLCKFQCTIIFALSYLLILGNTSKHVGTCFPNQGSNLCRLQWKYGVLTTGPPGKSHTTIFILNVLTYSRRTKGHQRAKERKSLINTRSLRP